MALNQNNERLYKGKAGQLHIMSLLLARGWNVATPEVDTGDDIFVARDKTGDFRKVQVKTTYTLNYRKDDGFKVKFNIPGSQLLVEQPVELIYAFVILDYLRFYPGVMIMERNQLVYILTELKQKITTENINFYIEFKNQKVFSQSLDLTEFLNNYSMFPSQF